MLRLRVILTALLTMVLLVLALPTTASAEAFNGPVYNDSTNPVKKFKINYYSDYVPQGLAYGKGYFFQTQYNWRYPQQDSIIVIHKANGEFVKAVYIAEGHVGGAAVKGNWLYVVTNLQNNTKTNGQGRLRTYSIDRILKTKHAGYVPTRWTTDIGRPGQYAGAFIGISGKFIYYGTHTADTSYTRNGQMWHHDISRSGKPVKPANPSTFAIPPNVQGVAVSGSRFLFSQSWDRDCWSRFTVTGAIPAIGGKSVFGPSMVEDMTKAGSKIYLTYESAAHLYTGGDGSNHSRNAVKYVAAGSLKGFMDAIQRRGWTSVPAGSNTCN